MLHMLTDGPEVCTLPDHSNLVQNMVKRRTITLILLFIIVACVRGEVSRIVIEERILLAKGHIFGNVGPYEKIRGKVYYEIDPYNAANKVIKDILLAPRNQRGMVECHGDFILLKPVDMTRANKCLLYDVNNRGNLIMLRSMHDAPGSNNPQTVEQCGNGFLMRQGYSLLWSGWNWDVVDSEDGLLQFRVPTATNPDAVIRQKSMAEIVNSHSPDAINILPLAWGNSRCYPSANFPDNSKDLLTVRDSPEGVRYEIPSEQWSYSTPTRISLDGGFQPGKIYELIYEVENPKIVGLGLAAVRDILSFFKYDSEDSKGNPNPLLEGGGDVADRVIDRTYIFGVSQSGRFIAHMIYQGFHVDEMQRMVFDGARIHVAGGGKGGFNYRFAQTTHHPSDLEGNYMPADHPPFNYLSDNDPGAGGSNDLLASAKRLGKVPKIIITNHALEYWTRSASLIHTTLDGKMDASVHKNVRIYMVNGAPHGTPWSRYDPVAEHLLSTLDIAPVLRATLVMLDEWVTNGIEPADSRYPRIDRGELITASEHKEQMPFIPGLRHPGRNLSPPVCDYGQDFWDKGIMTNIPPVITGHWPTFVPAVDEDGNGIGGIRLPEVAVPLGTYQGFNPRKMEANAPNFMTRFNGSFWPFAETTDDRLETGDQRQSLEERYGSKESYMEKLTMETTELLADRFLIDEDAVKIIDSAKNLDWPPVMLDTRPFWK